MKGKKGGNCNRTACQKAILPFESYYSVWTRAYYCRQCAWLINDANRGDARAMYGVDDCVFLVGNLSAENRAKFEKANQYVPEN